MKKYLIILFLFITSLLSATNYYVKNGGSNYANGLSDETAWATIAKVNATSFLPGDVIAFKKGNTWTESAALTPNRSGTSGNPIVYTSYGSGADPIIRANSGYLCGHLLSVSYVTFNGLVFDGTLSLVAVDAIKIDGTSNNNIVTNCTIKNSTASGIYIGVNTSYITVSHSEFINIGTIDSPESPPHGIYCTSHDNVFEYLNIHGCSHYGIHVYNGTSNTCNNNIIRYCFLHDNSSAGIIVTSGSNNKVYYNIVSNNAYYGIMLHYNGTGSLIYNNTVYNNTNNGIYIGSTAIGCVVRNNIMYNNTTAYENVGSATMSNNLTINPLFINAGGSFLLDTDFEIQSNSPGINGGADVRLIQDYAGNAIFGAPDIGAFENYIKVDGISVTGAGGTTGISTENGTLQLSATVAPSDASNKSVTWSITNGTGKGSISSSGLVTAIADGTVTAKATANDGSGVYGTMEITISNQGIPVGGITITGAGGATSISTYNGTLQLSATVTPSDATNKTVTWSITNGTGNASISSSGLVTAIADGTITAKAIANDGSGIYGTLAITISNQVLRVTGITITGAGGAVAITADNGTLQLSATVAPNIATNKTVTWSITNGSGKGSISSSGLVTAISNGTITAKATANDGSGIYGTLVITITNQVIPVSGITISGAGGAIAISADNGTLQLSATVAPTNATNKTVTWSITDGTGKGSISSSGLVTAISNGTVTATATANDGSGINGTLVITISNQVLPVTGITVTGAGGAIAISADNGTLQLSATVAPTNATNKTVTWSITDGTGKGSISSSGLVTAITDGTVTAKAAANDGSGIYGILIINIYNQDVPVYISSSIENSTPARVDINFSLTLANILPAASDFSVLVNYVPRSVNAVEISGKVVQLTLASPVVCADMVTVAYTKPPTNPLQTVEGVQAATIIVQRVANNIINEAPVIKILNPRKGNKFANPATIEIDVDASDPDGYVTKVEIFNGSGRLIELTSAPYSFTWKDVSKGNYTVTAVATDNLNSRTTSSPVEFTIEDAHVYDGNSDLIKLYPNPNDGNFSIEYINPLQNEKYEIIITDLSGRQFYNEPILKEEILKKFELSYIKPGIYIMMIKDIGIIVTKKFIKK